MATKYNNFNSTSDGMNAYFHTSYSNPNTSMNYNDTGRMQSPLTQVPSNISPFAFNNTQFYPDRMPLVTQQVQGMQNLTTPQTSATSSNSMMASSSLQHDKPLTELCVSDIIKIITDIVTPINEKLAGIEETMKNQQVAANNRITLLESRCTQHENKIETMSQVIASMQSCINNQDAGTREKNIIISGLSEQEIETAEKQLLSTDEEKVKHILHLIEIGDIPTKEFTYERVGKERPGSIRMLKVNVTSKHNRNKILDKVPSLRGKNTP